MANNKRMEGKRVLVTGSGTGIGRGMALEFSHEGASVALHYSHSDKGAESAVSEILKAGGKAKAFQADFNDTRFYRFAFRLALIIGQLMRIDRHLLRDDNFATTIINCNTR